MGALRLRKTRLNSQPLPSTGAGGALGRTCVNHLTRFMHVESSRSHLSGGEKLMNLGMCCHQPFLVFAAGSSLLFTQCQCGGAAPGASWRTLVTACMCERGLKQVGGIWSRAVLLPQDSAGAAAALWDMLSQGDLVRPFRYPLPFLLLPSQRTGHCD